MNKLLLVVLLAATASPAWATLYLYEPFDYTVGDRLGGSGTSPLGQVAPPANDTVITSGNLSYAGLASSNGNSVRYGSSMTGGGVGKYTDAIALPTTVSSGSLYYAAVRAPVPFSTGY